jgi:hypothetical protein
MSAYRYPSSGQQGRAHMPDQPDPKYVYPHEALPVETLYQPMSRPIILSNVQT